MDDDDVPLSRGAGYFADEETFAAYAATLGPLGPEVSQRVRRWCGAVLIESKSQAPAASSTRWDMARTGAECRVLWVCFARGTCACYRADTSTCRREKGTVMIVLARSLSAYTCCYW